MENVEELSSEVVNAAFHHRAVVYFPCDLGHGGKFSACFPGCLFSGKMPAGQIRGSRPAGLENLPYRGILPQYGARSSAG